MQSGFPSQRADHEFPSGISLESSSYKFAMFDNEGRYGGDRRVWLSENLKFSYLVVLFRHSLISSESEAEVCGRLHAWRSPA